MKKESFFSLVILLFSFIAACQDQCDEPVATPIIDQTFQVNFVNTDGQSVFEESHPLEDGNYLISDVRFYSSDKVELVTDNSFSFEGNQLNYSFVYYTETELLSALEAPLVYDYYIQFGQNEE